MKKRFFIIILSIFNLMLYAQGTVAGDFSLYPEKNNKSAFMLCSRTVSILNSSFCYYDTYDVVNCSDTKEEKTFAFQYNKDLYGNLPEEQDIRVLINDDELKCTKIDSSYDIRKFYYKCKVPSGHFTISYIINDSGHEIGGTLNGFIKQIDKTMWNLSDKYEEKTYINITNDYVSLSKNDFTIIGNGRKSGETFFLKSGCVYLKKASMEFHCQNFYNGCGGGSGCPTLSCIYNDDDKMHSSTEYIYNFITAARIVEEQLHHNGDYINNSYSGLIKLLKILNKDELRLFRNAFFAKNNYVFKDSALNTFFSSALCYFPDKSLTIDAIKKSEAEKILIEMIQAAEKDESPEAVFNKYKK